MNTPQVDDLLLWLGGIAAALIAVIAMTTILRKWLLGRLVADIESIQKELRPNGGSSVRDAIDRIAEKQSEIQTDVREVRTRVDDHIQWHLEQH
jgi:hypothetical protein